jgi:hypothetical protein
LPPVAEAESESPTGSAARPVQGRGAPSRFGRFLGPLGPADGTAEPHSSITVEPRSDPAAEAAVKRRIEKQIVQTLGDRVRSVEIRVAGRSVVLRAQASRFWQKRGVRRSLETMTVPSGYRLRVEMLD